MEEKTLLRISGACGIIASIAALLTISLSIATYPAFSWTDDWLSDLGAVPGITMAIYNYGLIIASLIGLVFARGLFIFLRGWKYSWLAAVAFAFDVIALMCVGIFPSGAGKPHLYASFSFFLLFPVAGLLSAYSLHKAGRKLLFPLTLVLAAVGALTWFAVWIFEPWHGDAIPEMVVALAVMVWSTTMGAVMLKETK